jgi:hypothetical protein
VRAAHRGLQAHYRATSKSQNYVRRFYSGLHEMDQQMQQHAFDSLAKNME